ncbi:hypothetical protein C8K30_101435 [Promicromonospora sp. AC04]|uniref:hypothetical protein n=1 Tax=Promicromonospora sp. AC04 TaxID=2135723 RepID=UPI000D390064|nr:hypothetical protein [Promicromonospora sp. AC04]PUB31917.1 hypothetical protein C8K30_101435 [Promicromonospora sp. AC04]
MDVLLAQLPAMMGVLIGVVGTLATTALTDAARWRREQRVRFDERLLDVSAEYAAAIREIVQTLASVTAYVRPGDKSPSLTPEEGKSILDAANRRRMLAWESLCLVADDATVKAGGELWSAAGRLEYAVRDLAAFSPDDWEPLDRVVRAQQREFYQAVRTNLAIGPLGVPVSRYEHAGARKKSGPTG